MEPLKDCLKKAREGIEKKDYKDALQWADKALQQDPGNYNALVFKGLAASNLDKYPESEQAYRKAIGAAPENVLAWRGLSDLYTKTSDWVKLVDVLKELIKLTSNDPAKVKDYSTKLITALANSGNYKQAIDRLRETIPPKNSPTFQQDASDILHRIYTIQQEGETKESAAEIDTALKALGIKNVQPAASGSTKSNEFVLGPVESAADVATRKKVIKEVSTKWLFQNTLDKIFSELRDVSPAPPQSMCEEQLKRGVKRRGLKKELQTKGSYDELLRECQGVITHYPNSCPAWEIKLLMQEEDLGDFEATQNPRTYLPFVHMFPTHGLGWTGIGLKLVPKIGEEAKNFVERFVLNGGGAASQSLTAWLIVAKWYMSAEYFHLATETIAKAEATMARRIEESGGKFDRFWAEFKLLTARVHYKSRRKEQAIPIYRSILEKLPENVPALRGLAEHAYETEDYSSARSHLEQILAIVPADDWAIAHMGWLDYLSGDVKGARARLDDAINRNGSVAKYHFWKGKILWDTKAESPLQELLIAAKLDSNFAPTFTLLGHYYRLVESHEERSRRCYQKALSLDILDDEAGQALSDMYIGSKQHAQAVALYRDVTSHSLAGGKAKARSRWAWVRLSLHQLNSGDWADAENSFQQALRIDPKDGHIWQGLGETYRRTGKFLAAKKALLRAVECLPPPAPYVRMQLAALNRELGIRDEAIEMYKLALEALPDLFPALMGLAETMLAYARELHTKGYFLRARETLIEGAEVVKKCAKAEPNFVSVWKLTGDLYTFHYHVPNTDFNGKIEMLKQGSLAYQQASKIRPTDPYLLYDLGVNYYYQLLTYRLMLANNFSTQNEIDQLTQQSVDAFQQAISFSPQNSQFWNALGTALIFSNPAASQHCLIFALNKNNGNADAWTNLGILYMRCGHMVLANQAFSMAQAADPTNVVSFLGRGLIYEMNGSAEGVNQAYSAYMHIITALQQDPHPEGHLAIGYTAYILKEYDVANTYLQKYLQLDPNRIEAHMLFGLVLEAQGLYSMAYKELSKAQELLQSIYGIELPDDLRAVPPPGFVPSVYFAEVAMPNFPDMVLDLDYRIECLLVNRARLLARLGKFDDALAELGEFEECADPYVWRIAGACEFLLDNQSEEAVRLFQKALQLASDDSRKEVLVALCQIYFKQNNMQKSKQSIAQCVKQFGGYTRGLFTMATLGLVVKEAVVTNAALDQVVRSAGPLPEVYYIQAANCLSQGKFDQAQHHLIRAVHQHPHLRGTWIQLGQVLTSHTHSHNAARHAEMCAKAASVLSPYPLPQLGEEGARNDKATEWLLARTKLSYGKLSEAVSLLQKQVRNYPQNVDNWFYLAMSLYFNALHEPSSPTDHIVSILSHLTRNPASHSIAFLGRIALADTFLIQAGGKNEVAKSVSIVNEALGIAENDEEKAIATRQLGRCHLAAGNVSDAIKAYKSSLQLDHHVPHVWQELGAIYDANRQYLAAESTLKACRERTSHHHLATALRMTHHHYSYTHELRAALDSLKDWPKKLPSSSPIPPLFQGILLTMLADAKQRDVAAQALAQARAGAMTKHDEALAEYFEAVLTADRTAMADSKRAEAKASAREKFWANYSPSE